MTDSTRTHEKLRALVDNNLSAAGAGVDLLILAKHLAEVGPISISRASGLREDRFGDRSSSQADARHAAQDDAGSSGAELDTLSAVKLVMELRGSNETHNLPGTVDVSQEGVANAVRLLEQLPTQWVVISIEHHGPEIAQLAQSRLPGVNEGIAATVQDWLPSSAHAVQTISRPVGGGSVDPTAGRSADHVGSYETSHAVESATVTQSSIQSSVAARAPALQEALRSDPPSPGAIAPVSVVSQPVVSPSVVDVTGAMTHVAAATLTGAIVEVAPALASAPALGSGSSIDMEAGVQVATSDGTGLVTDISAASLASAGAAERATASPNPAASLRAAIHDTAPGAATEAGAYPAHPAPLGAASDHNPSATASTNTPAPAASGAHAADPPAAGATAGHDPSATASASTDPTLRPAAQDETPGTADASGVHAMDQAAAGTPGNPDPGATSVSINPTLPAAPQDPRPATADASGVNALDPAAAGTPGNPDPGATSASADATLPPAAQDAAPATADASGLHAADPAAAGATADHDPSATASASTDPTLRPAAQDETPGTADASGVHAVGPAAAGTSGDQDPGATASASTDPTLPAAAQDPTPATADASGFHSIDPAAAGIPGNPDPGATSASADATLPPAAQDAAPATADASGLHAADPTSARAATDHDPGAIASTSTVPSVSVTSSLLSLPEAFMLSSSTAAAEPNSQRLTFEVGAIKPVEYAASAPADSAMPLVSYSTSDLNVSALVSDALRVALGLPPSDAHADTNNFQTAPSSADLHSSPTDSGHEAGPTSSDPNAHPGDALVTPAYHGFEQVDFTAWHSH